MMVSQDQSETGPGVERWERYTKDSVPCRIEDYSRDPVPERYTYVSLSNVPDLVIL